MLLGDRKFEFVFDWTVWEFSLLWLNWGIIITVFTASMSNFLAAVRSFWTRSFLKLEYNFLNNSEIVKGSNFSSSFDFRQTLVLGNFFSDRLSCFNVFQFFKDLPCFHLVFPQIALCSFFELNFEFCFECVYRSLHLRAILLILSFCAVCPVNVESNLRFFTNWFILCICDKRHPRIYSAFPKQYALLHILGKSFT